MPSKLPVSYRQYSPEIDAEFVLDSWLKSNWWSLKEVPNAKQLYSERIKAIMFHSRCLVACDPEDERVIYGYVVYEPDTVHWVYVKFPLRQCGMATSLLHNISQEAVKTHTTTTKAGKSLVDRFNSKFQPFMFERWMLKGKKKENQ